MEVVYLSRSDEIPTSEMSLASTVSLSLYPCTIKSVLFKALDSMCLFINCDYRLHVVRKVKIL